MLIHKLIAALLMPVRFGVLPEGESAADDQQEELQLQKQSPNTEQDKPEEGEAKPAQEATPEENQEETVVMIGDEPLPPPEEAAPWVKDLRRKFREQAKELAQLKGGQQPRQADALPPAPGIKPKISDPGIDFDGDKFAAELDKWHEAARKREQAESKARDQQAQEERAWKEKVDAYQDAAKKLGFADYEDCEAAATASLSLTQQAIIVKGAKSAEKAALVMYSLGRNMKLLHDVAKMTDPVEFAFAIAEIQGKLVMTKRKPGTKPEPTVPASGSSASSALAGDEKKVEELRAEALRTGDMTKLMNYRRQQREAKSRRAA